MFFIIKAERENTDMKRKIPLVFFLFSAIVAAGIDHYDVPSSVPFNPHVGSDGNLICRSIVNDTQANDGKWEADDIIVLHQNGLASTYKYNSSGVWIYYGTRDSQGHNMDSLDQSATGGAGGGVFSNFLNFFSGAFTVTDTTLVGTIGSDGSGSCPPWVMAHACSGGF